MTVKSAAEVDADAIAAIIITIKAVVAAAVPAAVEVQAEIQIVIPTGLVATLTAAIAAAAAAIVLKAFAAEAAALRTPTAALVGDLRVQLKVHLIQSGESCGAGGTCAAPDSARTVATAAATLSKLLRGISGASQRV